MVGAIFIACLLTSKSIDEIQGIIRVVQARAAAAAAAVGGHAEMTARGYRRLKC